jgi:iron complex outermembrane receptor protein
VLHGRAFRAPNPYELYYSQEPLSLGLQPERIVAGELVWEQRVAPRAYLTVSAFQSRVADLITQRTGSEASSDGLYFDNHAGRVRARGLEFEMEGDLPGWLHARGSWVHQVGVDRTTGERISNSPRNLGLFLLDVPIGRTGVQAALNAHYVGRRLSVHGTDVEAAVISNLTVSTRAAGRGFAWAVTARNLLGAEYGDPGAEEHLQSVIPQDGRTLSVRATWRF